MESIGGHIVHRAILICIDLMESIGGHIELMESIGATLSIEGILSLVCFFAASSATDLVYALPLDLLYLVLQVSMRGL